MVQTQVILKLKKILSITIIIKREITRENVVKEKVREETSAIIPVTLIKGRTSEQIVQINTACLLLRIQISRGMF